MYQLYLLEATFHAVVFEDLSGFFIQDFNLWKISVYSKII